MRVDQARQAARHWVVANAGAIPGFYGAYTAGSSNWLPSDAELPATTDLDIMVVGDRSHAGERDKFLYRNVLLEVSHLSHNQFQSAESILGDYHLAPSFSTANILLDPTGRLADLWEAVSRDYAKRQWVRKRCSQARNKILRYLRSIDEQAPLADQVLGWLFAAGVTCHVLLAAGLKNPTVRTRYVAVRDLLTEYGRAEFHETLLTLLGVGQMSRKRVRGHLRALAPIFDRAAKVIVTPFPFATDLREHTRRATIKGSDEMIARGCHREAMFWIAVAHSRCQKVLLRDDPVQIRKPFGESASYRELADDLGVASASDVRKRSGEVERILPELWSVAEAIWGANQQIKNG